MSDHTFVAGRRVTLDAGPDEESTTEGARLVKTFDEGDEIDVDVPEDRLAGLLDSGYLRAIDADGNDVSEAVHDEVRTEPESQPGSDEAGEAE